MNAPQNQGAFPRFVTRMFNPEPELRGVAGGRQLNFNFTLSGDDRDRTGNLLVANLAAQETAILSAAEV
jgi:hypothetical protein